MQNQEINRRNLQYNPKLKARARELRNNMTAAEKKLWFGLRQLPINIYRQKPIGNYIADFYIPSLKLVIEVDGESHIGNEDIEYDKLRTNELEKLGLKVVRFWNDDVLYGFDEVFEIINSYINNNQINPPNPLC